MGRSALTAGLLLIAGCGRETPPPASAPASMPVSSAPAAVDEPAGADRWIEGWEAWSAEIAIERLATEATRLSAAARLVQLEEPDTVCAALIGTSQGTAALRVLELGDGAYALGVGVAGSDARLQSPVVIFEDGRVRPVATGAEEEVAVLVVSQDELRFPHVVLLLDRLRVVTDDVHDAIQAESLPGVVFDVRQRRGAAILAIVPGRGSAEERRRVLVEYRWDALEEAFRGPAADKLPDPPGGRFELDLKRSPLLLPVGGEIAEPIRQPAAPEPERPKGPPL